MMYQIFLILFLFIGLSFGQYDERWRFEENGAPTGWTDLGGAANYDTLASLEGGESVRIETGDQSKKTFLVSYDDVWVQFIIKITSGLGTASGTFYLNNSATARCYFNITTGSVCKFFHGATNSTGSTVLAADTVYYFWVHYAKGTGANGVAELYISTDGDIPAAELSITTGTATTSVDNLTMYANGAGWRYIFDDVIIDADSIGNYSAVPAAYYIDEDKGSDSNNGKSPRSALASLDSINTAGITLAAGDTVFLRTGDTWRETLTVPASGSAGLPITFTKYDSTGESGVKPKISGADDYLAAAYK